MNSIRTSGPTLRQRRKLDHAWWHRGIRVFRYAALRYWWIYWLLLLFAIWYFLLYCCCHEKINSLRQLHDPHCCPCEEQAPSLRDTIPAPRRDSIPQRPRENCRVHFSGLFMGGEYEENYISKIYQVDNFSEYVGEGNYPSNKMAFPNSVASTFDGIAIDRGTRLIIYSKKNFKGRVLLDITGPAIINNVLHKFNAAVSHCNTDGFTGSLQQNYPQSVRHWSNSNMHDWSFGSCKIMCGQ